MIYLMFNYLALTGKLMERFFAKSTTGSMPEIVDLDKLTRDPSKRKSIIDYNPNQHEDIRRKYLMWGPHRPEQKTFKPRMIRKTNRYFNPDWYEEYGGNCLE